MAQARLAASALRKLLAAHGVTPPVRPVVIFPGWYVNGRPTGADGVWVLNQKAFPKWLQREPHYLSETEVAEIERKLRLTFERAPQLNRRVNSTPE